MKLIAYLLPQFHAIPENDLHWGKGFTEWTNTKKAKPLYKGHHQPNEPWADDYYCLLEDRARRRQETLAAAYGLHGFCYYHYWFKGKKLMEKPLELKLRDPLSTLPFCLSWANESWTRKWDGGSHEIIQKQTYGTEKDWKEHFEYVLPFFQDSRYVRVGGKPLFVIYRPGDIGCWNEMRSLWEKLAVKNGLDGIYWVRTLGGFQAGSQKGFDASVEFEPHYTFATGSPPWRKLKTADGPHLVVDYDPLWMEILHRSIHREGEAILPGAFVGWDNTPRIGSRGQSCLGATPEKFGWYLSRQIRRAKELYRSEFLFINAWNEWAEGTYLEPDRRYGFRYLEELNKAAQGTN